MKKKGLKTAIIGITAVSALGLGVATATADGVDVQKRDKIYTANVTGGHVNFHQYGDYFTLYRGTSHGNRIYVDFKYTRKDGTHQHSKDVGTQEPNTWSGKKDHNFGEGRVVKFRACIQVDGEPDYCGGWKKAYA